jgi:hypothetical protein
VGDHDPICNRDLPRPGERAVVADEDDPTDGDVQPVVGIKRRYEVERVADGLVDQRLERGLDCVLVVEVELAQFGRQPGGDLDALEAR